MKHNDKFETFNRSNPEVYRAYKTLVLNRIAAGHDRIGSKAIIETIRYRDKVKISNNYTAYYSRRFIREFPQFTDLFVFKRIR